MITIGFLALAFSIFRAVLGLPFINLDDLDQVTQNLEVIWGPMMLLLPMVPSVEVVLTCLK